METAGTHLVGDVDGVACAGDVGLLGVLRRGREVIHRREVEKLGAAELFTIVRREREAGLCQVARQRMQARPPGSRRSRCAA